jgi:hypothetical protein
MPTFQDMRREIASQFRTKATRIQRGTWQTIDVSESDLHITRELMNYNIFYDIPESTQQLKCEIQPDLPWADEHFLERVGRDPVNPPPSHVNWPHHGSDKERHIDGKVFSHTYPERFWPKKANGGHQHGGPRNGYVPMLGIRYEYGDLDGIVSQLVANPYTRQAILPIWFPEDTGAVDYRVPCTIAYHFMADADMRLHCWYYIRACDFVRHFHNDVYFASRLVQWIIDEVDIRTVGHTSSKTSYSFHPGFEAGQLNMQISSFHVFEGDMDRMP